MQNLADWKIRIKIQSYQIDAYAWEHFIFKKRKLEIDKKDSINTKMFAHFNKKSTRIKLTIVLASSCTISFKFS